MQTGRCWDGRFERTPQKHAQLTAVPHLRLTFSLESPTSVSLQLTDSPIRTYLGSYLGSAELRIDQVRNHVTLLLRLYFITAFQRARRQRGGGSLLLDAFLAGELFFLLYIIHYRTSDQIRLLSISPA